MELWGRRTPQAGVERLFERSERVCLSCHVVRCFLTQDVAKLLIGRFSQRACLASVQGAVKDLIQYGTRTGRPSFEVLVTD